MCMCACVRACTRGNMHICVDSLAHYKLQAWRRLIEEKYATYFNIDNIFYIDRILFLHIYRNIQPTRTRSKHPLNAPLLSLHRIILTGVGTSVTLPISFDGP